MINAKEARERMRDKVQQDKLDEIEVLIIKAIENLNHEICIGRCLDCAIRLKLQQLGYTVKVVSQYNETGTIISW